MPKKKKKQTEKELKEVNTIEEQYALNKLREQENQYEILQHEYLTSLCMATSRLNEVRQKIQILE